MKRFRLIAILGISLVLYSCQTSSEKYIDNYTTFANDFLNNYESYTAMDWDAARDNYEILRQEYATYMSDMTSTERETIDALNSKINAAFILHSADNASLQLESLFNEAIGTLNELLQ